MATLVLNRRRASLPGLLAAAVAIVTGIGVFSYLSYLRGQIPIAGKLAPMVVAATNIEPGTQVEPHMLELDLQPSRYLPEGALGARSAVEGKVVTVPVFKGEPITTLKMGRTGGLSSVVPTGQRAYSLAVASGASLGFLPRPGDRVDVIVTLPAEALGRATTQTVLRFKQVASVGAAPNSGSAKNQDKFGIPASGEKGLGITLFVDPSEAQRLAMAEALGKITVVLAPDQADLGKVPAPVTASEIGPG